MFKTIAYELLYLYFTNFLEGGVLTDKTVSRMAEAQLSSDLLVSLVGGIQTIKNIERYYIKYENDESVPQNVDLAVETYKASMQLIGAIYHPAELRNTNWSRPHWFYTLFNCVIHTRQRLIRIKGTVPPVLDTGSIQWWRGELDQLSALYDYYTENSEKDVPARFAKFINFAQRRTTDTEASGKNETEESGAAIDQTDETKQFSGRARGTGRVRSD